MYYISFVEHLKLLVKDEKALIFKETSTDEVCLIKAEIIPSQANACPACGSNNIIRYGKRSRQIKDNYLSNRPTFVFLEYSRYKCNNCLKLYTEELEYFKGAESISINTNFKDYFIYI